jgi:hypothetical protein
MDSFCCKDNQEKNEFAHQEKNEFALQKTKSDGFPITSESWIKDTFIIHSD